MNRKDEIILAVAGAASIGAILYIRHKNSSKTSVSSTATAASSATSTPPPTISTATASGQGTTNPNATVPNPHGPQGQPYPSTIGYHLDAQVYGGSPMVTNQTVLFFVHTLQGTSNSISAQQPLGNQTVQVTATGPSGTLSTSVSTGSSGTGQVNYPSPNGKVTSPGNIVFTATWKDPNGQTHTKTATVQIVTEAQYMQIYG